MRQAAVPPRLSVDTFVLFGKKDINGEKALMRGGAKMAGGRNLSPTGFEPVLPA
jgi:hypothetical protein